MPYFYRIVVWVFFKSLQCKVEGRTGEGVVQALDCCGTRQGLDRNKDKVHWGIKSTGRGVGHNPLREGG